MTASPETSSTPADRVPTGVEAESPAPKPFVPPQESPPELTWSALLAGSLLGIIFGASSLYLVLKVGMTISASIPVAVLSITLFRVLSKAFAFRRATILENNIVQTTGSAGESIAFGVGVTMPALMLLGFEMEVGRVMTVAVLGGMLGILMMIPLRRAFIVKRHDSLKYPEGTACAEVLRVGQEGGATAKVVFAGFGLAFLYQFLWRGMKLWREIASRPLSWFPGAVPSIEVNPALLGVGYIIGTRISAIMAAGGVLAYLVLIPAIKFFGDPLTKPLYPGTDLIRNLNADQLRNAYVLYIGAGAVAAGGILSLIQALPLIVGSIGAGIADLRATRRSGGGGSVRTDRDLPLSLVGLGTLLLVAAIWLALWFSTRHYWLNLAAAAVMIVVFGFLFVTVSSRLTGEIGSSSNPISGMTVATLLLTCLIFLLLDWKGPADRLMALSVAAVVCVAASNGGTTSQDLKTGFLVGATPWRQQIAILVGSVSSALVIGWVLVTLNEASTVYTRQNLPQPHTAIDVSVLHEQAQAPKDPETYLIWRATEGNSQRVPPGKYLVDRQGHIRYLVDPGINGRVKHRDNGTEVTKFDAPKANLMSLVTDGILSQKLPWTLVLLGVSIALVLELCGVPSLPFAVGVYLPLSSSTPILAGGLARWVVEWWQRRRRQRAGPSLSQGAAPEDTSTGVLLSTGYIAGGAIGGVLVAFLSFSDTIPAWLAQWEWLPQHNAPALLLFGLLVLILLIVGCRSSAEKRQ